MGYDDISDYEYVCCDCGAVLDCTHFFCGHPHGLPEQCPECLGTDFITRREDIEDQCINQRDAEREDDRLYGL